MLLIAAPATTTSAAEATAAAPATTAKATAAATTSTAKTASAAAPAKSTTAATSAAAEAATTAGGTSATATETTPCATTAAAHARLIDALFCAWRRLGFGDEALKGQQFVAGQVKLVAGLEASGLDALGGFDGKVDLVDGAENLVDLANIGLVFEKDKGVKLGDLAGVDALADHFAFAGVDKGAHLDDRGRRAHITGSKTTAAYRKSELSVYCRILWGWRVASI